jgi:hypothetical protein
VSRVPTRDEILASVGRLKTERVDVPEWGDDCFVIVRELTSGQSAQFTDFAKGKVKTDENAKLVSMVAYDEAGNRIFQPQDVDKLSELGVAPIMRIVNTAIRLSGLGKAQVEALEKNSEAGAA